MSKGIFSDAHFFLLFQDKVDAGMPTAMAVSSLIAIGTSHGLVLVFGKIITSLSR